MSIEKVLDTDLAYYLVSYDKNGQERANDPDGMMSQRVCDAIRDDGITDVFIMSHGWKGDIPAAKEQYEKWIKAMASCAADRQAIRQARPGFKALLVGFHWPSQPWGEEEFGMAAGTSFAASAAKAGATTVDAVIDHYVDLYADRIADTPAARSAIRTIISAAAQGSPLGGGGLPVDVADAYRALDRESGMGGDGVSAAPGDDREPFDPNRAYANAKPGPGEAPSFGGFGLSAVLSPLRQLSFWKMKDRARSIGESAGFALLTSAQKAVPAGRDVRFHLMGHSFGCIVVSSALNGPKGTGQLKAPIHSLTLVQGATSLWGYCEANPPQTSAVGYFRGLMTGGKVSGSILTTRSKHDTAVGKFYPIAAGIVRQVNFPAAGSFPKYGGIGAFGLQGQGLAPHDLPVGNDTQDYQFQRGQIYNLECTGVIKDGTGASGAHSDIAKPEVAHAMWEAVKVR
jgi:hypothetical protein